MNRTTAITILLLTVVGAAAMPAVADPERQADRDLFQLILAIIENPDPIAQVQWIDLYADPRDPDAREPGQRNDGRPVFEFDRQTQEPFLAWAYDVGAGHDIAFNASGNGDWLPKIEFITMTPDDELDPRMYVDYSNRLHLTWWENEPENRLMLAYREADGNWTIPIPIGFGRRPSLAEWNDYLVFAYERDNGHFQEVVFARFDHGTLVPEVVAATTRGGRLDPIVHVAGDTMWIDWKASDNAIAYSVYENGVWSQPQLKAWADPSWYGELVARREVELTVTRSHAQRSSDLLQPFAILPAWANWTRFATSVSSPTSTPAKQRSRSDSSTIRE